MPEGPRVLILACGALARELLDLVSVNGWDNVTVECLPAALHNTPDRIPAEVERRLDRAADRYDHVLVGYGDCGTGGLLDRVLERRGVTRLPGDHCYEFFATSSVFAALHDAEPGTFYLTDYLVKYFDRLVIQGLGLDRHPELLDAYFGNYRRVVYLSQVEDPALVAAGRAAAAKLGLDFEHRHVGYGDLATAVGNFVRRAG